MSKEDRDLIASLQSLVHSLQHRVKELEAENTMLLSRLSSCRCHEIEEACDRAVVDSSHCFDEKRRESKTGYNTRTLNHHCKRYVALKIMYFGQRFYAFASEAHMEPTIESEIFKAFEKTRLLVGDKKESQYSRCGRTDKGVSSVGQVIALFLRSNLKGTGVNNSGDIVLEDQYEGEIDYVRVLNRALPNDIRVLGWCPVPVGFSARFSCLSREYKYFFWRENLNLLAMESAGRKFVGEHDFRNFCKMDAVNVHNYRRNVTSFEIFPSDVRYDGNQLWAFKIKGTAFLWHQVRCMVSVLFLIGQGLESADVIDALLDTDRTMRKPQYAIAPELPLVLHSCEFESLKFICSADAGQALHVHFANQCHSYQLQAAIFHEALLSCLPISSAAENQSSLNNGKSKKKASYVRLMSRATEPSYEERRMKLNSKT
ncbi:tRNA pseudouridine(38/39) synthase-like isoform X2 [Quercus lobata]|uniref:tRNA pseudouridine(38/39) synthase-like isoform X2 n=1 Tax=Quercus lobata TaxID=97700 RepID=UPI0012475741|nr:tRNA pseudouridine(38/39) synthase-like isoform X2 [Quercus lobata]